MEVVNSNTGEIQQVKFRTPYGGVKRTKQDCSDPMQKRWKEIPPYAVDTKTGKFINKTAISILVPDEPFNIDEYIQSFKDDCDIYAILEKFALTGCTDTSIINKGVMSFGDISELPDNFNDLNEYFENASKKLSQFNEDTAKDILNEDITIDSIHKGLSDKIAAEEAKVASEQAKVAVAKKDEVSK